MILLLLFTISHFRGLKSMEANEINFKIKKRNTGSQSLQLLYVTTENFLDLVKIVNLK